MSNSSSHIRNEPVADKILDFHPAKQQYEIRVNSSYYRGFALFLFIVGTLLGCTAIPVILNSQMAGVVLLVFLAVPFYLFGLHFYYLSSLKDQAVIIDLQKRVLVYSTSLIIPFKTIKHICSEKASFFQPKKIYLKKREARQVFIEDHRGNKAKLFKCESEQQTRRIMEELSRAMGVNTKSF